MAKRDDKVIFRSLNDGRVHPGTVREVIGDKAVIVDAPTTKRGWEIVPPENVRGGS